MPKKKKRDSPAKQSQRFVETARALGVDESGKAFEKAMKEVLPSSRLSDATKGGKTGQS
jgi:hypothetical protein